MDFVDESGPSSASVSLKSTVSNGPVSMSQDEEELCNVRSNGSVEGDAGLGNQALTPSRTSSSEIIVCRICQSSGSESGIELQTTGCACKGHLSYVHERCLRCWVQTQRSIKCEVCRETYQLVGDDVIRPNFPPSHPPVTSFSIAEQLATSSTPTIVRVCTDPRRGCFGVVILMLTLTTISAASLTSQLESAFNNAWAQHQQDPQSHDAFAQAHRLRICYQMVLSVLVVLSVMFIGLLLMWILAEFHFWPRQRIHEFNWRALMSDNNSIRRQLIY